MFRRFEAAPNDPNRAASFEAHGMDLAVANAIRRTILTDIPRVGFRGEEDPSFEVLQNQGPLHNEFLLHRLGLLPLHMSEEETEAFGADEYVFELQVENTDATMLNVTTQDFQVTKNGKKLSAAEVRRLFPPHPVSQQHVLITRLRTGDSLHVTGKPTRSTARTHAGFAAGFCTYSFLSDPGLAAGAKDVLDRERAFLRNEHGEPRAFRFEIEPRGGLGVKYLFLKSLELLREKCEKTLKELYHEPSDYVDTHPWREEGDPVAQAFGYEFHFRGEDDTFGNVLQSSMFNHYLREKKPTEHGRQVTYVGYVCPHPLEHTMHLRLLFSEDAPLSEYIETLAESCRRLIADLHAIESEWIRLKTE